jgi:hypothetical protein
MLTIEIDDREVIDALAKLQRRVADLSPVMRTIGAACSSPMPTGANWPRKTAR